MPNQMIALQARGPQLPDLSRQTAQYANMMNMARQQEAAQRQAQQAQQEMDIDKAQEARAAALHGPALTKAQQDNIIQALNIFREGVADIAEGDVAAAEAVRADLVARVPGWDKVLPPATSWDRNTRYRLMVDAAKEMDKTFATPVASVGINERTGQTSSITAGGLDPRAEVIGEVAPQSATPTAPRATPTAPQTAAPAPMAVGEYGEARFVPEGSIPLTPYQQEHIREMQNGLGMSQPASLSQGANAGPVTPQMAQQIVDTAVKTGMMAQADFDQLMAMAPEQNKQPFMEMIRTNNITLQPSGMGQQPQFAVYRGEPMQSRTASLRDAPEMQTTMLQAQGRTPFIMRRESPAPAETPQQAGARALATRPSKQELYDAEAAKIKAARDAGPAPATQQQKLARRTEVANAYTKAQTLIDKAYNPKEGIIALARKIKMLSPDQKEAITGYSNYIPSFRGTTREADTLFGNLKGVVTSLGKDAAAASGAVGNMAVQEWKIAADMIANLDLANMTPRALDAQMDRIIEQVSDATNLAQQVYDAQYGDDVNQYPAFKLRGGSSPKAKTPVTKAPPGVSAAEWKAMTPAERKLWQ